MKILKNRMVRAGMWMVFFINLVEGAILNASTYETLGFAFVCAALVPVVVKLVDWNPFV